MKYPFRDGEREIPDYMGNWMYGIDTARLTFEEAIAEMNQKMEREYIARGMNKVISEHFSRKPE